MKNKINNILELWNEIKILRNDKIEKENIILSCANLDEKSLESKLFEKMYLYFEGFYVLLICK